MANKNIKNGDGKSNTNSYEKAISNASKAAGSLLGAVMHDDVQAVSTVSNAGMNRLFSVDELTGSSRTGDAKSSKEAVHIDTADRNSVRTSLNNYLTGLQKGTIKYDRLEMSDLAGGLSDLFGRFVTSFDYCDQIVNELLQNDDSSAIKSETYGPELKKYWTENSSEYKNFKDLAASWVDLVSITASNNEQLIDEVAAIYKENIDR